MKGAEVPGGVLGARCWRASERPENEAIADRAAQVLTDYTAYREKYIGEGKRGVVEMLRDLVCDETALCAPAKRPRKP